MGYEINNIVSSFNNFIRELPNELKNICKVYNKLLIVIGFSLFYNFIINLFGQLIMKIDIDMISRAEDEDQNIFSIVLRYLVLYPLIETLIFQSFIYKIRNVKWSKTSFIIISGTIFGLAHCYSLVYIILILINGLFLALYYFEFSRNNSHPILNVTILHVLFNLASSVGTSLSKYYAIGFQ